jgi:Taurine catabolism dioxygenase TauD, TfdA family
MTVLTMLPEAILKLLYDHIDKSADNQARVRWEPYTVVLWDNRVTAHVSFCPTDASLPHDTDSLPHSPRQSTSKIVASAATVLVSPLRASVPFPPSMVLTFQPELLATLRHESHTFAECKIVQVKNHHTFRANSLKPTRHAGTLLSLETHRGQWVL